MSAMQERGREEWKDRLEVFHWHEVDTIIDEIMSFAAEREAKARREAVEDERKKWLAATKKVWPFTNHLSDCKLEPDTCGFGEATKPLLDLVWPKESPATEKCEKENKGE